METITEPGVYVGGTLVAAKPEQNGYRRIYVSTDPAYGPLSFSVRVGGDVDKQLAPLGVGQDVLLRVAAPRLGKSKTGSPFVAGFYILEVVPAD